MTGLEVTAVLAAPALFGLGVVLGATHPRPDPLPAGVREAEGRCVTCGLDGCYCDAIDDATEGGDG